MGTDATPHLQLEFDQIYSVRTLEQGEHERVRVKPNDAKRVLQLAYEEGAITSRVNAADEFVSLTCNHTYSYQVNYNNLL